MAITQNWTRYETLIGWYEVSGTTVLNDSVLIKLLKDSDALAPTYNNGTLEF